MNKKAKTFLLISCILFSAFSYFNASAFELSRAGLTASVFNIFNGVTDFFSFFGDTVVGKVRNDFCGSYFSSSANGEWKADEFRTKIGSKICTESVAIKIDASDKKEIKTLPLSKAATEGKVSFSSTTKIIADKIQTIVKPQNIAKKVETSGLLIAKTDDVNAKINKTQIIALTNVERAKTGLSILSENSKLDSIAEDRVNDMFAKSYFEHVSPSGESASSVADKFTYGYIVIGENIALGNFENTQALITAWMNSEGHRKNILSSSYTEIGVYAKEADYKGQKVWLSAQIFGKPLSFCDGATSKEKEKIESTHKLIEDMKTKADKLGVELNSNILIENPNLYNAKVSEYKILVDTINSQVKEMNSLISIYNNKVKSFNECIKK